MNINHVWANQTNLSPPPLINTLLVSLRLIYYTWLNSILSIEYRWRM